MPVSMAALHSLLNLRLLSRSSAARDDRLQREGRRTFHRGKAPGQRDRAEILVSSFYLLCSVEETRRERETKRERQKEQRLRQKWSHLVRLQIN